MTESSTLAWEGRFGNADLKIEMRLAQTLAGDKSGATYELPLVQEKGNPLESVSIAVRVKPELDALREENNESGRRGYLREF